MQQTQALPAIVALDNQMRYLLPKITNHCFLKLDASKHLRIRINAWVARLQSIISNNTWRKNRNNYLKLLYIMLESREIMEPFTCMAPEELPSLQKHQINCILLKLATRIKQRQRDKQNKQPKPPKTNPTQLWNTLTTAAQSKQKHPYSPNPNHQITLSTTQNKNPFPQPLGIDMLSPISQGVHLRANSNFSQCTYSSIQKFRDLLTPKEKNWDEKRVLRDKSGENGNQTDCDDVKYFRKNRNKNNVSITQIKQKIIESSQCKQQFYYKIFEFLKKHEQILEDDIEYQEVMSGLTGVLSERSNKPHQNNQFPTTITKQRKIATKILETKPKNQRQQKCEQDREDDIKQYDYASGQYSQYSSIEMDEGIPDSRIKTIQQNSIEESFKRKNFCQTLCHKVGIANDSGSFCLGSEKQNIAKLRQNTTKN